MRITEFSLRNPLIVTAIAIVLLCFGLYGYTSMGVGIVPKVTFPGVTIITTDSGADPATIETQVTKPIEDAVATLPNVDRITSTSSEGVSSVTVQFTTAANATLAPVEVERTVNSVRNKLPSSADPPSISTFDTSAFPVITVAASGPQTPEQLKSVATDRIQRAFERVPGVQSVQVQGGTDREIHVNVDVKKLQAYGLGINTVQQALANEQIEAPAGLLTASGKDTSVRLNALVSTPAQLGQIIVSQTSAGPIYLKDVASIDDSIKTVQVIDRVNGTPAVTIIATKTADANTLAVSQGVRKAMVDLQPELPQGMQLYVVSDAADYTQQSFFTVRKTLLEAVFLTGLILLLFLHTWRSTLIVLVAIPTSVLTTMGIMLVAGQNLNLFSMLAMTLAVGILVDDSIVVLENIYRHMGLGEPPVLAALKGRSEIGLAALTITMVDVVVYVPLSLISGIAGDFIRPFPLVIAFATLTSLVVSFTLTPMLASRFLTASHALKEGRSPLAAFGRVWDRGFEALAAGYRRLIHGVLFGRLLFLGMRWLVIVVGLATFAFGISLFATGRIGIDIFPSGDQSEVDLTLTMPPATTLEATNAVVQQIEAKLKVTPEVREVYSLTGGTPNGFSNAAGDTSQILVLLVPPTQRSRSSSQIADQLRQSLDPHIVGSRLTIGLPNAFGFGGFGAQPIQVQVQGPDPAILNPLVDQVTAAVKSVPGAIEVNNQNEKRQPEYIIRVDRAKAADLGVTAQTAANALSTAINGTVAAKFRQPGQDDVDIRVLTDPAYRATPDNLPNLPILSNNGTVVQLGQLGTITSGSAPTEIDHYNRLRSVTVSASAIGAASSVQQQVQAKVDKLPLPPGYTITYSGFASTGLSAFADIFKALGVAVVLMYLLMLMLFRSVTLPLAVLMSLPLAVVGALGAMALTGTPFTLFSLLGFAVLLGLVGKNAILLVDYTDTLRKRGHERNAALLEAGPTRLRPIVMTTASIFAGLAPVALGIEPGSELLRSAAVVLIGGLLTSTLLTLVFVPAMYTIFDDIQEFVVGLITRIAKPRPMEPAEEAILHPAHANGNGVAAHDGAAREVVLAVRR